MGKSLVEGRPAQFRLPSELADTSMGIHDVAERPQDEAEIAAFSRVVQMVRGKLRIRTQLLDEEFLPRSGFQVVFGDRCARVVRACATSARWPRFAPPPKRRTILPF